MIDRRHLLAAATLFGASAPVLAVPSWQDDEERRRREDWAWIGRYAEENRRLLADKARVGIVFMGDSITQGWRDKRPSFFAAGRIGRGIGGQTTPQMLVRIMPDVIALRPRAVHIMAGTNDIAGNTGPMTLEQTEANLTAMAQLAQANGIRCCSPPFRRPTGFHGGRACRPWLRFARSTIGHGGGLRATAPPMWTTPPCSPMRRAG
jgi:hypothetical protein